MTPARTFALFTFAVLGLRILMGKRIAVPSAPDRALVEHPDAHHEGLDTYQLLLDESLALTFPASDPVSAYAATRCAHPRRTLSDAHDWQLRSGSEDASRQDAHRIRP